METMEMGALKKLLFEELKRISNRELVGDALEKELDRGKMINEFAKTYITASMAEIKMAELIGVSTIGMNQNGTDVKLPAISGGKRWNLLTGSRLG